MSNKFNKVTVLGAARSGFSAAKLLSVKGKDVFVSELGIIPEGIKAKMKNLNISWEEGKHSEKLYKADLIVVSPGISPESEVLKTARIKKIKLVSEIEIAWHFLNANLATITGTNGKSTTTALLGSVLKEADLGGYIGGNIAPGEPLSNIAAIAREGSWVSAEISSFQMQYVNKFTPDVVIWTNISSDHLDRHKDIMDYASYKLDLVSRVKDSGFLILNSEDRIISKLTEELEKEKHFFGKIRSNRTEAYIITNGIEFRPSCGENFKILEKDINIKGICNLENIMAAGLAAIYIGVSKENIIRGIKKFKGLPHRLEVIGKINDILFINNSMCTNVHAFERSLEAYPGSIVITGGKPKNTDFQSIAKVLKKYALFTVLIGESKDELSEILSVEDMNFTTADTMDEAVKKSIHSSKKGNSILLNPGMASFDMFDDFQDRGNKFREAVLKYSKDIDDDK